jgi:predicted dehydrogenase
MQCHFTDRSNDMAGKRSKGLIRVGVVGIGRGYGFARAATEPLGMKLVALCDNRQEPLAAVPQQRGYSDRL